MPTNEQDQKINDLRQQPRIQRQNCLVEAACKGDVAGLATALGAGAEINSWDDMHALALHEAAAGEYMGAVKWLLERRAWPNLRNSWGQTSLHRAIAFDHEDVAELLLSHGASVNVGDVDGLTPLHLAAEGGNLSIVRRLLEVGADVEGRVPTAQSFEDESHPEDYEDECIWTPLFAAVRFGHVEVAKHLRGQDASLAGITHRWETALHLAVLSRNPRMAQWVLSQGRRCDLRAQERDGQNPLELAGCENDPLMQRYLWWYLRQVAKTNG